MWWQERLFSALLLGPTWWWLVGARVTSCHRLSALMPPSVRGLKIHWKSLLHTVECTHSTGVCCGSLSEPQWEGSAQQSGKQTAPHHMMAPFVAFNCVTDWGWQRKLVTRSYLYFIIIRVYLYIYGFIYFPSTYTPRLLATTSCKWI